MTRNRADEHYRPALVDEFRPLFGDSVEIETEALEEDATRRTIARLADGREDVLPPRTRLNAARIDISRFPPEHQNRMQWLLGRLNIEEMAHDDVYALDYFLKKFVIWTDYQIADAPQLDTTRPAPPERIAADLDRAYGIVSDGLRNIDALRRRLRGSGAV